MAENRNYFKVDGVLFSKHTRTVQGKKDPTQQYQFRSFVLEIKSQYTYKDKQSGVEKMGERSELVEFDVGKGVDIDSFSVKDVITVSFRLTGKQYDGKNGGKVIFSKNSAYAVNYADLDAKRSNHTGNVPITPQKETVFIVPDPADDAPDDDLPF